MMHVVVLHSVASWYVQCIILSWTCCINTSHHNTSPWIQFYSCVACVASGQSESWNFPLHDCHDEVCNKQNLCK